MTLAAKLAASEKEAVVEKDERVRALTRENERLRKLLEDKPHDLATDAAVLKLRAEAASLKAKNQQLFKALSEAEAKADLWEALQRDPNLQKLERLKAKPSRGSTVIIGLNDWHAEERVDPDTINGFNEFNLEISQRRVKRTFEKALYWLDFARTFAKIEELVLWLGGDLISGFIHEELRESNYLSPTEACLFVQDQLCSLIPWLLKESGVKRIIVPTNHGNHGRVAPQKPIATSHKHSFEFQLFHQLARYFASTPQVAFKIEKGIHNWLEVQGQQVRFHHGDHIRYQGGVGGISIPVNKAIADWNKAKRADLDLFGHFHSFVHHWRWVCGGCLVGYNPYALSIKAEFQPPTQPFVVVSREYGKVLAMPLFCEGGE